MPTSNTACCRVCGRAYELPGAPFCGHSQMPPADSPLGQLLASFKPHGAATDELQAENAALREQITRLEQVLLSLQTVKQPEYTACDDGQPCWCGYSIGMGPTHAPDCLRARAALTPPPQEMK